MFLQDLSYQYRSLDQIQKPPQSPDNKQNTAILSFFADFLYTIWENIALALISNLIPLEYHLQQQPSEKLAGLQKTLDGKRRIPEPTTPRPEESWGQFVDITCQG